VAALRLADKCTQPELSVIIPALNEAAYIADCLNSLLDQRTETPFEVVLVDNNCTDDTVRLAATFGDRLDLRIVPESQPGRGAARRAGFASARGSIVVSADADTRYPADWLETLHSAVSQPGTVAATTTARVDDLSWWANWLFNLSQPLAMLGSLLVNGYPCLSGFSFAIRRAVYEAAGGFDADLNANEDADLSRRVARIGPMRLVFKPVTFSGRRFRHGLVRGAAEYVRLFWENRWQRRSAYLSDVRCRAPRAETGAQFVASAAPCQMATLEGDQCCGRQVSGKRTTC
jgi:glycosyltransferase involved in cell wall biosynthesis